MSDFWPMPPALTTAVYRRLSVAFSGQIECSGHTQARWDVLGGDDPKRSSNPRWIGISIYVLQFPCPQQDWAPVAYRDHTLTNALYWFLSLLFHLHIPYQGSLGPPSKWIIALKYLFRVDFHGNRDTWFKSLLGHWWVVGLHYSRHLNFSEQT